MKSRKLVIFCLSMLLGGFASAAIVVDGDISPADIGMWDVVTSCYIAGMDNGQVGSVTMDAATDLLEAGYLCVGRYNSEGTLDMSGGSELYIANSLTVGYGTEGTTTGKGYVYLDGAGTTVLIDSTASSSYIGKYTTTGKLYITNGAQLLTTGWLGTSGGVKGTNVGTGYVTVKDPGSNLTANTGICFSYFGVSGAPVKSYIEIANEANVVSGSYIAIGWNGDANADVLVTDEGTRMSAAGNLIVARYGNGVLKIRKGAIVKVSGALCMNIYGSPWDADLPNNGYIAMNDGGKLALYGDGAASISAFLGLIDMDGPSNDGIGTNDTIKYWNGTAWDNIANATAGVDYTLAAGTGDLTGFTVLTVTAPGPCEYVIKGDFNNDCTVNFTDFAEMAGNWMIDCVYPGVDPACGQ